MIRLGYGKKNKTVNCIVVIQREVVELLSSKESDFFI